MVPPEAITPAVSDAATEWAAKNIPKIIEEHLPPPLNELLAALRNGEPFESIAARLGRSDSVNASSQFLYWSTQSLKLDASFATFAYDMIKWDESGLSIAGVTVYKPKYIDLIENNLSVLTNGRLGESSISTHDVDEKIQELERRLASRTSSDVNRLAGDIRRNDMAAREKAAALSGRIGAAESKIRENRGYIERLARGQQNIASTGASEAQRRSNVADARAQSLRDQPRSRRAVLIHSEEASRLNGAAESLRRVRDEALRLERELAGSGS